VTVVEILIMEMRSVIALTNDDEKEEEKEEDASCS